MAYSTTYPPGTVSLLGQKTLKANNLPHITYVGHDGTKFYLAGPLAPTLGAQNGLALLGMSGLMAPFEHLDVQGARQDGTTWLDSVYNPGEIDVSLEISGITAADTRDVTRSWFGANSPKKTGRLHVFSPENGEWWASVRQLKGITDQITQADQQAGRQRLTWAWRNDDAFWKSFDSVGMFGLTFTNASDDFQNAAASGLGTKWSTVYRGGTTGGPGYDGFGNAMWYPAGTTAREAINRYMGTSGTPTTLNGGLSTTDNQVIKVKFHSTVAFDFWGGVYIDIWGRMDAYGNGIRARIGGNGVIDVVVLSSFTGGTAGSPVGTESVLWWQPLLIGPLWNEKWTLLCGTSNGSRNFKIQRGDGFTVVNFTENGTKSLMGSGYRGWGFGQAAGPGQTFLGYTLLDQIAPPSLEKWQAADNITPESGATQSGYITLTNRGDQDAWPRYLCYGPGTFTFSDGASPSTNTVTFGPILEDQVALVTTTPRLRGVVDLSTTQQLPQTLTKFQSFIDSLVTFAVNNNVPPLLEQWESSFGITPPQGPLYSLLTGRFTTPLDPKPESSPPVPSKIAVSIQGGNADSKIVAAVTPQRLWPL